MGSVFAMLTLVLLVISFAPLRAQSAAVKVYPVDESSRDPSFQSYVKKLRSAVTTRSTKSLRQLVDDDRIVVGPEKHDQGWQKFLHRWRPNDPETVLWTTLADVLSLGFTREQPDLFLSPYVVWRFPKHLDRRKYMVVAREKVVLRELPSPTATTRGTLSFDVVRPVGKAVRSEQLGNFVPVEALDGRRGYVMEKDLLSPLMARAQFRLRQKRWLMIALESD